MKIIKTFLFGIKEGLINFDLTLYIWFTSFVFSLVAYIPVSSFFYEKVGKIADTEIFARHPDFLQLLFHSNPAFPLLLNVLFFLLILYFMTMLFIETGVLNRLVNRESFKEGKYFYWKFLKVEILLGITLLISGGFLWLLFKITDKIFPLFKERAFFFGKLGAFLIWIILVLLLLLALDFAKIEVVSRRKGAFKSFLKGISFAFRNWFILLILYLLVFLFWFFPSLGIKFISSLVKIPLISFLIMQGAFLLRSFAKVLLFAGEISLYFFKD